MRFGQQVAAMVWLAACEAPQPVPVAASAVPATAVVTATASAVVSSPPAASSAPSATTQASAEPPSRCPPEMIRIGAYCIDKWEAHLVSRNADGEEVVHPRNIPPDPKGSFEARSQPDVWPQGHISRVQAESACRAAGKRMCAWIEWRRACQGSKWWRWPYGNELRPDVCNSGKQHLIRRMFGDDPSKWQQKQFNDPRLNDEPGFLAKTGTHPECVSPDGVYDMVGNLHEWVIDSVSSTFVRKMDEEGMFREKQPYALGNGMFLGGFYSTRSEHGMGCFFTTIAHAKSYYDYSTGFRCCKDASPP